MRAKLGLFGGLLVLCLVFLVGPGQASAAGDFRKENRLTPFSPPAWFLAGNFLARERNPRFIFGPVEKFAASLAGKSTWLIEDCELARLKKSPPDQAGEFTVYLEKDRAGRASYWVFVVLPHKTAREWFWARRKFHGRKADGYYGKTLEQLKKAVADGRGPKGELRFIVKGGQIGLQAPEEVLLKDKLYAPVYDLEKGTPLP